MPARKLNPDRVAEIRRDYEELSQWDGPLIRGSATITSTQELADHHDISKSRLFELKRNGWRLSNMPAPETGGGDEALREVIGDLTDRVVGQAVYIAKLEAEVADLEHRLNRAQTGDLI